MGIVGSAFRVSKKATRVSYRATRTTYRAGKSISKGRVPGVSVGVGALGFGVRVGTRGIRIKSPIAGVSLGSSGFRTTVGVPGIAHVSVRPLKPSAVVGIGPLRAHISRHPGVSFRTGLVGVGVTTQPMFWTHIGAYRVAIPGRFSSGGQRWYEEIDNQWKAHYKRRPPSFLAELHDVIEQAEIAPLNDPFRDLPRIQCPQSTADALSQTELTELKKVAFREAFKNFQYWKVHKLLETVRLSQKLYLDGCHEEIMNRQDEANERAKIIKSAFSKWQSGDLAAQSLVIGATLSIIEPSAFLVDLNNQGVTILVIAPELEDIHPEKPAFTPTGQQTVKKKTKSEIQTVHTDLIFATALTAANAVAQSERNIPNIRVVVAVQKSTARNVSDLSVAIDYTGPLSALRSATGSSIPKGMRRANLFYFQNSLLKTRPTLGSVLPQFLAQTRTDAPAIAFNVSEIQDISSEGFWLEVAAAIDAIPKVGENVAPTSTSAPSTPTAKPRIQNSVSAVGQSKPSASRPIIDMSNLEPPRDIQRPLINMKRAVNVEREEKYLMGMVEQANTAVKSANAQHVLQITKSLLERLPTVPVGADDEAELVFLELIDALIVLIDTPLMNDLQIAVSSSNQEIRDRFFPMMSELTVMVAIRNSIMKFVKKNPNTIQSTLAEVLQLDKLEIRRACWYLDHFDCLVRTKAGNSYRLEVAE
jgi:hypothetical protein